MERRLETVQNIRLLTFASFQYGKKTSTCNFFQQQSRHWKMYSSNCDIVFPTYQDYDSGKRKKNLIPILNLSETTLTTMASVLTFAGYCTSLEPNAGEIFTDLESLATTFDQLNN